MRLLTFNILRTVYHRTPTCGGMDSEFSHTTVEKETINIVVPDAGGTTTQLYRNMAERYVNLTAIPDKDFRIVSVTDSVKIDAIIPSIQTKI